MASASTSTRGRGPVSRVRKSVVGVFLSDGKVLVEVIAVEAGDLRVRDARTSLELEYDESPFTITAGTLSGWRLVRFDPFDFAAWEEAWSGG